MTLWRIDKERLNDGGMIGGEELPRIRIPKQVTYQLGLRLGLISLMCALWSMI